MRKILPNYYNHVKANPDSLLSRIFGLHRVKLPGNKKIHFVVMGNVFPPHKDIHKVYDLKGSSVGRFLPEAESERSMAVLKDKNWIKQGQKLYLGPEKEASLMNQMEIDVKFLQANRIMDYSFLIGIHDMVIGNKETIRERSLTLMDVRIFVIYRNRRVFCRKKPSQTRQTADHPIEILEGRGRRAQDVRGQFLIPSYCLLRQNWQKKHLQKEHAPYFIRTMVDSRRPHQQTNPNPLFILLGLSIYLQNTRPASELKPFLDHFCIIERRYLQ